MGRTNLASNLGANLLINPSMDLGQRKFAFPALAASAYTLDRWKWSTSATTDVDVDQSADVPINIESIKSIKVTNNSATPIGAAETTFLLQRIEGFNIRSIKKRNLFVSFYVKSSLVGFYSFALFNSGGDQNYAGKLIIDQANVWQKVTFLIPLVPTDVGAWNFVNGSGLSFGIGLSVGANSVRSANFGEWVVSSSNDKVGITGQLDFGNNAGATFFMTQIQIHGGVDEIPFNELLRDFGQEIILSQRYYEKNYKIDEPPGTATIDGSVTFDAISGSLAAGAGLFKVIKRTTPIIATYGSGGTIGQALRRGTADVGGVTTTQTNEYAIGLLNSAAQWAVNESISFMFTADAEL